MVVVLSLFSLQLSLQVLQQLGVTLSHGLGLSGSLALLEASLKKREKKKRKKKDLKNIIPASEPAYPGETRVALHRSGRWDSNSPGKFQKK
jgi:hypothetical protein